MAQAAEAAEAPPAQAQLQALRPEQGRYFFQRPAPAGRAAGAVLLNANHQGTAAPSATPATSAAAAYSSGRRTRVTAANSESATAARTWRSVTACVLSVKAASSALSHRMLMRRVRPAEARATSASARGANTSGPR